jgi:hypothetical protein
MSGLDGSPFYQTSAWAYDSTLALGIAGLWWLAEFCSSRSKRCLSSISDWNIAWSCLTVIFMASTVLTFACEQYLRSRHQLAVPTTVGIVVAASLAYILSTERLRMFDKRARLLQKLLRADKLRFGGTGSLGFPKYVIAWDRWRHGDPNDAMHWREAKYHSRVGQQVLWDWGINHRIGGLTESDLWTRTMRGGIDFWSSVGSLLFFFLPTGAHEHITLGPFWKARWRLRRAYLGSMGLRIGCNLTNLSFDKWLDCAQYRERQFQLIAMEYNSPTEKIIDMLHEICRLADSPASTAHQLVAAWETAINQLS